ncbi:MAG: Ltp family lipoprotein [Tetragenococcus koreensis]|nr:Ltp family lipoprotein [Tetragenococcus koreensis]MDN6580944.1 Ltp family lipoprotein [Tetragenococcus koreensis]MDN6751062.1 Ltp family lipoprotein [Staphylococcus equorum]
MDIVFTALFIAAAVGIWYFIKKSPSKGKRNLSIVVLIVSALGVSLFSEDDPEENLATASSTQETSEVESTQSSETNEESTEESEEEPTKKTQESSKIVEETSESVEESSESDEPEEENDVPREYQSALNKAKTYVDMMNMSEQGLYDQLTSEAGEQFPEDAAQYAIENVETDYNENALKKAENYQDTMDMSVDGIYDQLVSEAGENFTPEQAQYAVDNLSK